MNITIALVVLGLCIASHFTVRAEPLSVGQQGIQIDGGTMGTFTIGYPSLETDGGVLKIVGKSVEGNLVTVRYDAGVTLTIEVKGGDAIYSYQNVRTTIKEAKASMSVPIAYQQGGKWKMGDSAAVAFPVERLPKPHLYQGNASRFSLINHDGNSFTIQVPEGGYLELNDLREWNDSSFSWQWHMPFKPNARFTVTMATGDIKEKTVALVDEFGQLKAFDWPDKVKSTDELVAGAKREEEYYTSLTPPGSDKFGGMPGSGEKFGLHATGFFHVEKKGDKWMLVDPEGNLFFHIAPCSFQPGDDYTVVKGRENAFDWLPPCDGKFKTAYMPNKGDSVFSFHTANMIRKYGKPYAFGDFEATMIDRCRKWGFNSVGAFSAVAPAVIQAKSFPYVSNVPLNGISNIPGIANTWDPFDPDNVAKLQANFAKELPAHADDPLLIGYFLTNEPLYQDISKQVASLPGTQWACKRELVQTLRAKYHSVEAFNEAWRLAITSFDALTDEPLPITTKEASRDMHEFAGKFLTAYFKLVADTFHQHDPHHMLIGNRFQSGTINDEQLCRIAGKYLDVMSFNYYTYTLDKDFLDRIYGWTGGRPMFLSEFYWSADKESGLSGGLAVNTQQQRGLAYRSYVEQAAALGYVVGVEWFTLIDQAATGRWFQGFTGERSNTGLISVADRPYKPMLAEMMKTNYDVWSILTGERRPFTFDDPHFAANNSPKLNASIPHAAGKIRMDGTTQNWPGTPAEVLSGKRVVQGVDSAGTEGTFKVCWDHENLYLLVNVVDLTPLQNNQATSTNLWDGDGIEVFLGTENIGQGGALQFSDRHLIIGASGAGKARYHYDNSPRQYACDDVIVPNGNGKGYTVEMAVPWEALGIAPNVGTKLLFDLGINDSSGGTRQRQLMWNGTSRNSSDRTYWGTATLLE